MIATSRAAQRAWVGQSLRDRLRRVRALRSLLVETCDELCHAVGSELSKSPAEALVSDVLPFADACKFLERQAESLLKPRRVRLRSRPIWLFGQRDTIYRRPHGLVGIIGTWNYPLFLNGVQMAQALTAGNGVLWKPSEISTQSASMLHALLIRAGYPSDLVQMLPSTREAGAALAEADVDHIVFTGSAATGRKLATKLGERLVSSTLELSGCDALFVLADADVELAANAAWFGSTINHGQTCIAVRRAFVQRDVYSAFVESLEKKLAAAGPMRMATEGQVRQAERLVVDATARGGHVAAPPVCHGGLNEFAPRIIIDANPAMAICREDCFAPLMAVLPFDDVNDALKQNDQCRYGLGASVFTRDRSAATRIADHLETGMVAVNDVIAPTAHPATPFGGRRLSGWGTTQGPDGLLAMTVPQVVSVRSGRFRLHYEPVGAMDGPMAQMTRGLLQWGHASSARQRWKGFWRMLGGARRMR